MRSENGRWSIPGTPDNGAMRTSRPPRRRETSVGESSTWILSHRRCNDRLALIVAEQRPGDEPRSLHLFDKVAKVAVPGGAAVRRAHRLPDLHEAAVEEAQVWLARHERRQGRLHTSHGV